MWIIWALFSETDVQPDSILFIFQHIIIKTELYSKICGFRKEPLGRISELKIIFCILIRLLLLSIIFRCYFMFIFTEQNLIISFFEIGQTRSERKIFIEVPETIWGLVRLHRCWWPMLETKCFVENYEILVTIFFYNMVLKTSPPSANWHQHKVANITVAITKFDPKSYKSRRKRWTNETMVLHLCFNNWCCFSHRYCNEIILALHAKIKFSTKKICLQN